MTEQVMYAFICVYQSCLPQSAKNVKQRNWTDKDTCCSLCYKGNMLQKERAFQNQAFNDG